MNWIDYLLIPGIKAVLTVVMLILSVPVMVLMERKLIGRIQQRPGPNRVGPWGILQTIVDGIKLLLKEDYIPPHADRALFILAPMMTLIPAMLAIAIVPLGPPIEFSFGDWTRTIPLGVTDLPIGILFYLALTSVGVYGIVLAGWSSNNKYSLLGGIRSTAQLISYEITLGLSLVGVILIAGTFNVRDLVASQTGGPEFLGMHWDFLTWHLFRQPLGLMLFLVAGFAEVNRLPFDLPEGESELGAGFHTEYSSLKFAMFMMAEYINILTFSAILATLFLGGFHAPIAVEWLPALPALISGPLWLGLKIFLLFSFFILVRGTLPRLRYDQLMDLGWKVAFPLAVANIVVTAAIIATGIQGAWLGLGLFAAGVTMILVMDLIAISIKRRVLNHAV